MTPPQELISGIQLTMNFQLQERSQICFQAVKQITRYEKDCTKQLKQ